MDSLISRIFFHNWQRKLVAIFTAIIIWLFVNHSINETKTISNIPIRVINLPADKTIQGLLPNGMLSRRITLTLTGSKDVISELEPSDLEVVLDASTADTDEWIVQISKKNLVSLNPSIDLLQHISQVDHTDFVIKLSRLVTAKVPVIIKHPIGKAPPGYEFLDVWPQRLAQTVSGPEEDVRDLAAKGLLLTFDLSEINEEELNKIKSNSSNDEISFPIPKKWKQIAIPFRNHLLEELNDPDAQKLSIDFLRKEFLPLSKETPIHVFYPLNDLDTINPKTYPLAIINDIKMKDEITILSKPLFAKDVSRLFIDVIRNAIEIVVIAAPKSKREVLTWSIEFINPRELEDIYVAFSIANTAVSKDVEGEVSQRKEMLLRKRFREYMQRMTIYLENTKKLHIKSTLENGQVRVFVY